MGILGNERSHRNATMVLAVVSIVAALVPASNPLIIAAADNAVVIGSKRKYLWGQGSYLFTHNTSIVFEAPAIAGWTFDHTEIDFGCQVGGVTGSNVSSIFAINHGYILECRVG